MTVTIQNHVYPQPCEPETISAAELVDAAEQFQACVADTSFAATANRRGKVRRVIEGLLDNGVRPAAIPAWLLVIMALVELMPEIIDIIQRIIDAINAGQSPAEVLAENRG